MPQEIHNIRLLGHSDLLGYGNIGEGMAVQALADGRRIMWLAHESAKDFTAVDVTDPTEPVVILQMDLPHPDMRSNSLSVVGDVMYLAHQTSKRGLPDAGMLIYDVSEPERPRKIGFFDATGTTSRGVHCLWCVDGHYAHLTTTMPDATPHNPRDDHFYVIADVSDPENPREAGRWWIPGTMQGDDAPPPVRHPRLDAGFGMHNANVYPRRPDRAYCAFKDGGVVILDIADVSRPKLVARLDYHPPLVGWTHTALPLFDRDLLVVTEEAVRDDGEDWPKRTWILDMSVETNLVMLASLPMPDVQKHLARPGRFGAHNVHENPPVPTAFQSEELVFGTYFNAGLRVHDISDPFQPVEVAHFIPEPPDPSTAKAKRTLGGINLNDVYVDENRTIYTVDREQGGLYILELEGVKGGK